MYYVIQVQTGKEEKTIEDIKKSDVMNFIEDVFSPRYVHRKKDKGEFKDVSSIAFPGYIFIDTNNIQEVFKKLYFLSDFTKILGREKETENFLSLNDAESRMIEVMYNKKSNYTADVSLIDFTEGDQVRVIDGPLFGLESKIKRIDKHKRKAYLSVTIGGRSVEAALSFEYLMKK